MNCWKSVNITKEFGQNRLSIISFMLGLISFIFLYVPLSIVHSNVHVNESGILPLIAGLIMLPVLHTLMHILPLIIMNKRVKLIYKKRNSFLPLFTYYTKAQVTKKVALAVMLAPTLFITVPGMVASYLFADFYVYLLLLTSVHIGMSFTDILYARYISKAPKASFIENDNYGVDILIKAAK